MKFTHAGAQAFAYPRNDPGAFDTLVVLVENANMDIIEDFAFKDDNFEVE